MVDVSFFSPYAVGGATRPDSFTGLNPLMQSRLMEMLMAAKEELGPDALRITSGYRSPELQGQLYEEALKKYGTPEATRKWVAPAGRSQHNFGTAVDFANQQGQLLRDPNSPEAKWLKANAAKFGLSVPLANEPWQVELEGARSGNISQGQQMRLSTKDAQMTPMDQKKPETLWGRLTNTSERSGLNPLEAFASALDPLIMPELRAGGAIREMGAQRAALVTENKTKNRTIEMLKAKASAGDKIAAQVLGALDSGAIDAKTAMSLYLGKQFETPKDTRTTQIQNYEYWISKGYTPEKAAEMVKAGQSISIDKGVDEFAKSDAQILSDTYAAGLSATRNLNRIGRLEELLSNVPTGAVANIQQLAGNFGIQTEGLDDIQAAQALINSLVPEQRPAGSGPMSDADLELFKQSMPRIINSPNGNQIIINTLRGIAEYDAQGASIVQKYRSKEIDKVTAFQMLQERKDPFAAFRSPSQSGQPTGANTGPSVIKKF